MNIEFEHIGLIIELHFSCFRYAAPHTKKRKRHHKHNISTTGSHLKHLELSFLRYFSYIYAIY